jgi:hypothetical protein
MVGEVEVEVEVEEVHSILTAMAMAITWDRAVTTIILTTIYPVA